MQGEQTPDTQHTQDVDDIHMLLQKLGKLNGLIFRQCILGHLYADTHDQLHGIDIPAIGNPPLVEEIHAFIQHVFLIGRLHAAFRAAPNARIHGPAGVANHLGMSRNNIYLQLKSLGLTHNHFKDPSISLEQIVPMSAALRDLASRISAQIQNLKVLRKHMKGG